jgi:glycosyltransferase involved in cell wall biosynthesis
MNVLVVDQQLLTPDHDAGSHRMFNLVKMLQSLGHEVSFSADHAARPATDVGRLEAAGIRVAAETLPISDFQLVILSRAPVAARQIQAVKARWPKARVVFDTVDLHHVRAFRAARLHGNRPLLQQAMEFRRMEFDLFRTADQTWVVTEDEREVVRHEVPHARVHVVSIPYEIRADTPPFSGRRGALFIGTFLHQPNVDAVQFYAAEILPKLRARLPDFPTRIVGGHPPDGIRALGGNGLEVAGWQRDLAACYANARLAIAPLRFGAGLKGKVLEAMSHGLPIVGTSVALEGISAGYCRDAMIADQPDAFAEAMLRLSGNEAEWTTLSARGKELIHDRFSVEAVRRQLEAALADLK